MNFWQWIFDAMAQPDCLLRKSPWIWLLWFILPMGFSGLTLRTNLSKVGGVGEVFFRATFFGIFSAGFFPDFFFHFPLNFWPSVSLNNRNNVKYLKNFPQGVADFAIFGNYKCFLFSIGHSNKDPRKTGKRKNYFIWKFIQGTSKLTLNS